MENVKSLRASDALSVAMGPFCCAQSRACVQTALAVLVVVNKRYMRLQWILEVLTRLLACRAAPAPPVMAAHLTQRICKCGGANAGAAERTTATAAAVSGVQRRTVTARAHMLGLQHCARQHWHAHAHAALPQHMPDLLAPRATKQPQCMVLWGKTCIRCG